MSNLNTYDFNNVKINIGSMRSSLLAIEDKLTTLSVKINLTAKALNAVDADTEQVLKSQRRVKDIRIALTECKDAICFLEMAVEKAEYDKCISG
jgi:hypothetical protein